MRFILLFPILFIVLSACNSEQKGALNKVTYDETAKANEFFEKVFEEELATHPELQARLGIKKDYGKWNNYSETFEKTRFEKAKEHLRYLLDSIKQDNLSGQVALSYELMKIELENKIRNYQFRDHNLPLNPRYGYQTSVPSFLINNHVVNTETDAEKYIERLNGIPELFDQRIEGVKRRVAKGIILPTFLVELTIESAENVIAGVPFDATTDTSVLFQDFVGKLKGLQLDSAKEVQLISYASKALRQRVQPAYESLVLYLNDFKKSTSHNSGAWSWPQGKEYYQHQLELTTSTNFSAQEIHDLGLKEVARIHDDIREIMTQVAFDGSLYDFFEFMREDDQFYFENTEEGKQLYLDSATAIIENMKARLDRLFLTKPKADLVVKRIEAYREKTAGKAFYNRPLPDGTRPGIYYVNLFDMQDMPTYEMEALAYHEGIPGHHMQRAISQEIDGLPRFRQYNRYTAYTEGWGLYSEWLPKEIGMYQNPYADYGRLAMELWRACRLVVDTGIHHYKWTKDQAVKYYFENTSAPIDACIKMVERHFVNPGQATAYKIGMNKMLELRQKAEDQLGNKFDVRHFHDVILINGAVPLSILDQLVVEYIAQNQ